MRRRDYHWSLYHTTEKNQLEDVRTDQVEAIYAAIPARQRGEWFLWKEGLDSWRPFDDFPELLLSLRKADTRVFAAPPPFDSIDASGPGDSAEEADVASISASASEPSPKHGNTKSKIASIPPAETPSEITRTRTSANTGVSPETNGSSVAVKKSVRSEKAPQRDSTPTASLVIENENDTIENLSLMRAGVLEDRVNMRFDKALEIRIYSGDEVFKNVTTNISLKGMQVREALPKSLPRYFHVEIGKGERRIPVVCSEVGSKTGPATRLKIESNENPSALLTLLLSGS